MTITSDKIPHTYETCGFLGQFGMINCVTFILFSLTLLVRLKVNCAWKESYKAPVTFCTAVSELYSRCTHRCISYIMF